MITKIIAATGEADVEKQVNSFIMGRNVIDIKLTEWVSYKNQTGGYTAFITYQESPPTKQIQVRIIGTTGDTNLENQVNNFITDKTIIDIKFTEWAEYEAQTGGYTALIIYVAQQEGFVQQAQQQAIKPEQNPSVQNAAQFDVL